MMKHGVGPGRPWIWGATGVGLVVLVGLWLLLPTGDWIATARRWITGLGPCGPVAFGILYIVATVALAPAAPLSVVAGLAFGGWGIPLVLITATTGASLAFLLARYLMRDHIRRFAEERPKLKAVDIAVGEEGWKIVALLRLSPLVPFNLQNYLFGVTKIGVLP